MVPHVFLWMVWSLFFKKPTTGFMPNGVELKAERREPSGENYARLQTFHHIPECLRTSSSTNSTPFGREAGRCPLKV